jgi:hypothetical protein
MSAAASGWIAFVSVFLGLVSGTVPVSVAVGPGVASIELRLDGSVVARRRSPPWTADVALGAEFTPHELVAVALDSQGAEVATAKQSINLPRPPAEIEIVPERDGSGRIVAARLLWQSLVGSRPTEVRVTLDGRALPRSGDRVSIPDFDGSSTHVLTVELEFPMNIRSRRDLVLGGASSGDARSELTAVPVRSRSGKLPRADALSGWFAARGKPIVVAAVEHGPADVLIVRDLTNVEASRRLARPMIGGRPPAEAARTDLALAAGDRVQIVWPAPREFSSASGAEFRAELFERSRPYDSRENGLHWLLTRVYYPVPEGPSRRFADAVAVAGLQALAGYSRRAVVLVRGHAGDASRCPPASARHYLETIRVPLHVWSLVPGNEASGEWGAAEDVSSYWKLREAVARLKADLESQWIVWVEGRYLPQEIERTEKAEQIELVR